MEQYQAYINLRTKDVLVNGVLVYSEVRYVLTDKGREYLRQLRIEEQTVSDSRPQDLATDIARCVARLEDLPGAQDQHRSAQG